MSMTSDDKDHLMQDMGAALSALVEQQQCLADDIRNIAAAMHGIRDDLDSISNQIDMTGRRLEDALLMIAKALRESS